MKKTRVNARNTNNVKEVEFTKKVISQVVVSIVIFTVALVNSKLHNNVSVSINRQLKHYLTSSIDFNETLNTMTAYFQNIWNELQTLPVNGEVETADES